MNKPLNPRLMQARTAYQRYRIWLLCVFLFSVINVFMLVTSESYLLFSSYLALQIVAVGYTLAAELGDQLYVIVAAVLAVISVVPYLLCFIFSKKRVGWTVAGFVLFILDTLLLCYNAFITDPSLYITDIIIHLICVVTLGIAIVKHKELRALEREAADEARAATEAVAADSEDFTEAERSPYADCSRSLVITRKKAFAASLVIITCYIDGIAMATLKNGETVTLTVSGEAHKMIFCADSGTSDDILIPEGADPLAYTVSCKTGMVDMKIIVDKA